MRQTAMKTEKKTNNNALRERAEQFLAQDRKAIRKISSKDLQSLIHELEVHQIELEMQNEELRNKQAELEEARNRYLDLYEFAPVSYFVFDRKGGILEVNLTGVKLLGVARSRVVGMPFTFFLDKDSITSFLRHMMDVFSSGTRQTCELIVCQKPAKRTRYVSVESIAAGNAGETRMRSAVIDVTERKLAGEEILRTQKELAEANERHLHLSERLLEVQEEERRRIANEVHDGFASSLAAIRMRLSNRLANAEGDKIVVTGETLNQLRDLIDEARRIQTSLRPSVLDDLGVVAALNWLCREFRRRHPSISVKTKFPVQENEVREPIKLQIFRIAQESLDNIAKHAGATLARVSLTRGNSSIDLVITDNGRGFDAKEALSRERSRRGLGLSSMKERATLSGGAFSIESVPGKGTTLRASWPLTECNTLPSNKAGSQ